VISGIHVGYVKYYKLVLLHQQSLRQLGFLPAPNEEVASVVLVGVSLGNPLMLDMDKPQPYTILPGYQKILAIEAPVKVDTRANPHYPHLGTSKCHTNKTRKPRTRPSKRKF